MKGRVGVERRMSSFILRKFKMSLHQLIFFSISRVYIQYMQKGNSSTHRSLILRDCLRPLSPESSLETALLDYAVIIQNCPNNVAEEALSLINSNNQLSLKFTAVLCYSFLLTRTRCPLLSSLPRAIDDGEYDNE